jgi:diphosphomevalonate decarboxylase
MGGLVTRTTVSFSAELAADALTVNGREDAKALQRVSRCLDMLRERADTKLRASVVSANDFPTGAGLASSASGYAALVKAAQAALNLRVDQTELDLIARIGSGSAPRSLHPGIVLLEKTSGPTGMHCRSVESVDGWPLEIIVAVTSQQPKEVSSTGGMESGRETSPCYQGWVDTHATDLADALQYVGARDFEALAEVSERSCLKMHAVAMSSVPPLVYWSGPTVACMQRVRELRQSGVAVFFTIDAGPQVKAVCLPEAADQVRAALAELPGVLDVLSCTLGEGAHTET